MRAFIYGIMCGMMISAAVVVAVVIVELATHKAGLDILGQLIGMAR